MTFLKIGELSKNKNSRSWEGGTGETNARRRARKLGWKKSRPMKKGGIFPIVGEAKRKTARRDNSAKRKKAGCMGGGIPLDWKKKGGRRSP